MDAAGDSDPRLFSILNVGRYGFVIRAGSLVIRGCSLVIQACGFAIRHPPLRE